MSYIQTKPFIKWAGGKSQLLDEIRAKYPDKIERYCEPFVGGGAVLLDVLANFKPQSVLINDINRELINTYMQIQASVEKVVARLLEWQAEYWAKSETERREMYGEMRDKYNAGITEKLCSAEMAALFIFLNKTCFNGLYRVNRKGLFNVPIGSYKKPPICDADNLRAVSELLKGVEIRCGDYSECDSFIDSSTFVYIDPPYRPLTQTASFTSYSDSEFGDKQQIKLGTFVSRVSQKGAKVVVSNSDPKNVDKNDMFFDELYSAFCINRVGAKRMINSKGNNRGVISELLICNF